MCLTSQNKVQPEHGETKHSCPRGQHRGAAIIFQQRRKNKASNCSGKNVLLQNPSCLSRHLDNDIPKSIRFLFYSTLRSARYLTEQFESKLWLEVFTIHFYNTGAGDVKFSPKWQMADILAFHFRMLVQSWVYKKLLQVFTLLCSLNEWLNFY